MSSINNALLPTYSLRAQSHAVLVASVADGAEEIERLQRFLLIARAALVAIKYVNCDVQACRITAAQGLEESK